MDYPKPVWVFQEDTFDEGNPERMEEIVRGRGMIAHRVGYEPFVPFSDFKDLQGKGKKIKLYKDDCVVLYGSINLVRAVTQKCPWIPTAWMSLNNLRCRSYLSHWGKWSVHEDYCFTTWAELGRLRGLFYDEWLSSNGCLFIKPDENLKTFSGKVVHENEFKEWYGREQDCHDPDAESLVLVSKPSNIAREWRLVVHCRKVVAASLYKKGRSTQVEPGAPIVVYDFAAQIAKHEWQPDPIYVMDVCELEEGGLRLLEIGSVNSAGLYACDLEAVVTAMTEQAEDDWREAQ